MTPNRPIESLYNEHKDTMFTLAYRMTGERDTALDLLQDLFVRLLEKPALLPPTPECAAYLHKSIMNRCTDFLRRRKPISGLDGLPERAALPDPNPSELDDLAPLFSPLTPDQRAAVTLKTLLGYSLSEIAGMTGVEEGTVKSRLSRALDSMRQTLAARKEKP